MTNHQSLGISTLSYSKKLTQIFLPILSLPCMPSKDPHDDLCLSYPFLYSPYPPKMHSISFTTSNIPILYWQFYMTNHQSLGISTLSDPKKLTHIFLPILSLPCMPPKDPRNDLRLSYPFLYSTYPPKSHSISFIKDHSVVAYGTTYAVE